MHPETLSDPQLNTLLDDWISGRDQNTFVYRNEEKSSGWDKGLLSRTDFFLPGEKITDVNLLTRAFKTCNSRINSMLGKRAVSISFRPGDSYTDSRKIVISTDVVDYPDYSPNHKIDVLRGLATHEALHILHTDFSSQFSHSDFQHNILNVIEDERIEHLLGHDSPGHAADLESVKEFYFNVTYKEKELATPAHIIIDCFFKFVRYPKYLDKEQVREHFDFLSKIKEILTPYPLTFIQAYEASVRISELFKDELSEQPKSSTGNSKQRTSGTRGEEDSTSGFKNLDDQSKEEILNQLQDAAADLLQDLLSPNVDSQISSAEVKEAECLKENDTNHGVVEGTFELRGDTVFETVPDDRQHYNEIAKQLRSQARALAHALVLEEMQMPVVHRGMRSGKLDTARIVDAHLGSPNIYIQQSESNPKGKHVILLLDMSGSMNREMDQTGISRIACAQNIAILFKEALQIYKGNSLYIYGYSADMYENHNNTIFCFQEPGFKNQFALGSVKAYSSNRDGVAITEVAKRVRTFTPDPALMIIISDGQPNANDYAGNHAIEHTREAVVKATRSGFDIIQVGISVNPTIQSLMFDQYVSFNNYGNLVLAMKQILRKNVRKRCIN